MVATNIPMSADTFVASLRRFGLTYKEHGKWKTFNRNGGGRRWGPVNGFMVHNFASDISDLSSTAYLLRGDAARGMPPPICQLGLDDDGVVHLLGWGRANHAGKGDPDVLKRVQMDTVPMNGELTPKRSTVDGNPHFVGVEMYYGNKGPTAKQRWAIPRLCAAFLEPNGWAATSVIAHREWTNSRSDPQFFSMATIRQETAALLSKKPTPVKPSPPKVNPPKPQPVVKDEDMPLSNADLAKIATIVTTEVRKVIADDESSRQILTSGGVVVDARTDNPDAPRVAFSTLMEDAIKRLRSIESRLDAIESENEATE